MLQACRPILGQHYECWALASPFQHDRIPTTTTHQKSDFIISPCRWPQISSQRSSHTPQIGRYSVSRASVAVVACGHLIRDLRSLSSSRPVTCRGFLGKMNDVKSPPKIFVKGDVCGHRDTIRCLPLPSKCPPRNY